MQYSNRVIGELGQQGIARFRLSRATPLVRWRMEIRSRVREPRRRIILKLIELRSYAVDLGYPAGTGLPPLLIFGQGRTGSTVLESLLASTGYFRSRGEMLNTDFRGEALFPLRFVEGERKRSGSQRLLCHMKPKHLTIDRSRPVRDTADFLSELDRRGWRFLHLSRRNTFEHALSELVAERRGYFKTDDVEESLQIKVDCNDLINRMNDMVQQAEVERSMLGAIDRIQVVYEDDILEPSAHQQTIDRILEKIGLESRPVSTEFRKVNTHPPSELIVNFAEVVERLQHAGFGKFVGADPQRTNGADGADF